MVQFLNFCGPTYEFLWSNMNICGPRYKSAYHTPLLRGVSDNRFLLNIVSRSFSFPSTNSRSQHSFSNFLAFLLSHFLSYIYVQLIFTTMFGFCGNIGLDGMHGKTIGLRQVCGKEQVVVRLFPSAAVTMIKHLLIQL